jgi:hypothetical protein
VNISGEKRYILKLSLYVLHDTHYKTFLRYSEEFTIDHGFIFSFVYLSNIFIYLHHKLRDSMINARRWVGHVARMEEGRGAYMILVGRPAGRRPLGRPRRRWEDNIKMDLQEVEWPGLIWLRIGTGGGLL